MLRLSESEGIGDGVGFASACTSCVDPGDAFCAFKTSAFVIRPSLPVPEIEAGSNLVSVKIFRTAGDRGISSLGKPLFSPSSSFTITVVSSVVEVTSSFSATNWSESVSVSSFCSLLAGAGEATDSSILAMVAPISTSSPSLAKNEITPDTSARPSWVILSVSNS